MELDKSSLDRLISLDDKTLGELTKQIAQAAGADSKKTANLLENLDFVRNALSRMTPSEAESIIKSAGKEKSDQIFSIIKKGESKNGG